MAGRAEQSLDARHHELAEGIRAAVGVSRPLYLSASAFRFAYDPLAPGDIADVSAPARQLGLLIEAVTDQPFTLVVTEATARYVDSSLSGARAGGPAGDPLARYVDSSLSGARAGGPAGDPLARFVDSSLSGAGPGAVGALVAERRLLAGLGEAARVAAADGCRALEHGWFEEADQAFRDGLALASTEPFLWFGAGLAVADLDPARSASCFERAGRYLLPGDAAGSVYCAILAAALLDRADDRSGAVRVLERELDALGSPCPAVSLHLACLGKERPRHVSEALAGDPMLDADVRALALDAEEATKERTRTLEAELRSLNEAISGLRAVDGGPVWRDELMPEEQPAACEDLSLARLEVVLWQRVATCRNEIEAGHRIVREVERARQNSEADVLTAVQRANRDLLHQTARPFLVSAVLIAVAIVALSILGEAFRSVMPSPGVSIVVGLGQLALVVRAVRLFIRTCWPHRAYGAARKAKLALPGLQEQAAQLRRNEFDVRRRFNRAMHEAERGIDAVIEARSFVVPARPTFSGFRQIRGPDHAVRESGRP